MNPVFAQLCKGGFNALAHIVLALINENEGRAALGLGKMLATKPRFLIWAISKRPKAWLTSLPKLALESEKTSNLQALSSDSMSSVAAAFRRKVVELSRVCKRM